MPALALELGRLPGLALVLAQVLYHERPHVGDGEQPLARRLDGEAPEIRRNPAPAQLLGHCGGRARAAETVKHKIAFVGGGFDDALEQGFGFLSGIAKQFSGAVVDGLNIIP